MYVCMYVCMALNWWLYKLVRYYTSLPDRIWNSFQRHKQHRQNTRQPFSQPFSGSFFCYIFSFPLVLSSISSYSFSKLCILPKLCIWGKLGTCGVIRPYYFFVDAGFCASMGQTYWFERFTWRCCAQWCVGLRAQWWSAHAHHHRNTNGPSQNQRHITNGISAQKHKNTTTRTINTTTMKMPHHNWWGWWGWWWWWGGGGC